ncbi:MAG: flagellar filament capping protein FliD [Treponema sp.]|nr:flagellar filament capping protein FliD [Treponema sp.]
MSDLYIPGIRSRFNTDQLVEDLMRIERLPRDRAANTIERLQAERSYWQEINRRSFSLRESARHLFSFQNPFNDRIVSSADELVLTGTARRDSVQQELSFTVQQVAQADRFLSSPMDDSFRVGQGTYTYTIGSEEISFDFRGGTLSEFSEALNRRGRDLIRSSLITVRPGSQSLLIESLVTGRENRLGFSGAAMELGEATGMVGRVNDSRQDLSAADAPVQVPAGDSYQIPVNFQVPSTGNWVISFETATSTRTEAPRAVSLPPPGPSIPSSGSISYGGIVIENHASSVNLPGWAPPPLPARYDNMDVLSLRFSDGSRIDLPPIRDSSGFTSYQFSLRDLAQGRMQGQTLVSMELVNDNTHRDISIQNVAIYDPQALGGIRPLNPVSEAQDAHISMQGIRIERPTNEIDDLVPGLTLTVRGVSDRPVRLSVEADAEAIKEAVYNFVGNYNRLMAEINILTRNDERVLEEITYLSREERAEYQERLGAFSGDSTLNQIRSSLMRIMSSSYPTSAERDLALLNQIGIGTNIRQSGIGSGSDPSQLRGYLDINERVLEDAISSNLIAIRELFGTDTTGDFLADTGIAVAVDALLRPYTETGGIFTMRSNTINSRIDQETRRIGTLDRQLANREAELRRQYAMMESAYRRMEQMSTSLQNMQQQNNNNR